MEISNKQLEQIVFNTKHQIEKHILNIIDESTHEESLSPLLQTNLEKFNISVTFPIG